MRGDLWLRNPGIGGKRMITREREGESESKTWRGQIFKFIISDVFCSCSVYV